MSNPRRTCKFLTPFLEPSGDRYKLEPQFPLVSKESEDIEHQPLKKPRVSKVGSDSMMIPERRNKWLPYKTQLCQNFKRGCCHYGEACLFAHGINDIRNTVPNSENEKGLLGRTKDAHHRIYDEFQLCRWFFNGGQCAYGDKCRFRHVIPKSFRDESVITISTSGSKGSLISGSGQFGCKRSLGMDFDTNGENVGRHFGKQSSVAAGRGLLNNTCMASGHFAHGHAGNIYRAILALICSKCSLFLFNVVASFFLSISWCESHSFDGVSLILL